MKSYRNSDVVGAYKKIMQRKGMLYMRSRPWRERIIKNPFLTVYYALLDRFWYGVVAFTKNPLLHMKTFWGAEIIMRFPDYRCVLHHGLIDSRELPVEDFLVKTIKPGDVFMDIGSNVGYYALLCDALGAKAWAFEPTPETFLILSNNITGTDIVAVNKALMDSEKNIKFVNKGVAFGTNTAIFKGDHKDAIEVEATTLDIYCSKNNIHPTILKIDVEEAESFVIRGGEKIISLYKPIFIVETEDPSLVARICLFGYKAFSFNATGEIIPYVQNPFPSPNLLFRPL